MLKGKLRSNLLGGVFQSIQKNLPMTDDERKSSKTIVEKLTQEFDKERNIIYEKYVYNACVQGNQSFDRYLAKLRELIATCKYGTLENEILHDKIVIDINNNDVREKLLREKDQHLSYERKNCDTITEDRANRSR